jgi:UTP--glucose-1-phosphate uridylyltransferase
VITSRRKKVLEDYLDREIELETFLKKNNKKILLDGIKPRNMNFSFIRQEEMKGTGHALLLLKPFMTGEPFIVAYPDDIILSEPGVSKRLCGLYERTGKNVIAARIENINISRYGVIQCRRNGEFLQVEKIIEKPSKGEAPGNMVSVGRYLFTPEILEALEEGYEKHKDGEYYHIYALNKLSGMGKVIAYEIEGLMLDTGERESYLMSLFLYVERHPEGSHVLRKFLDKEKIAKT